MKALLTCLIVALGLGGCAIVPAPGPHGGGQVVLAPQIAVVHPPVVVRPWGYGYGRGYGHYRY